MTNAAVPAAAKQQREKIISILAACIFRGGGRGGRDYCEILTTLLKSDEVPLLKIK
jgi:hypothetical protein